LTVIPVCGKITCLDRIQKGESTWLNKDPHLFVLDQNLRQSTNEGTQDLQKAA